jgi:protein-S-isoprenylcysteine O-methyltransferase Ste14
MTGSPLTEKSDSETPAVIARPPLLLLGALLLGFGLDHLVFLSRPIPGTGLVHTISAIIAGALLLIGVAVFAASIRNFSRAGTPVQGTRPTRTLVTSGIYGWSRNPIYLAMLFFLAGIGIAVRSPWILLLAVPLAITFRYGVIAREEAYLERRFSDAYRDYKAHVRRWL